MNIYLVSQSPRRKRLLSLLFEDIKVIVPRYIENDIFLYRFRNKFDLEKGILYLAKRKLYSVIRVLKSPYIAISGDTVVLLGNRIIGKPKSRKEAMQILKLLSGRKHEVFTGIFIVINGKEFMFVDRSVVLFRKLDESYINSYLDSLLWRDKAGGYGIQERDFLFVERVYGSVSNVAGFPLGRFISFLIKIGFIV